MTAFSILIAVVAVFIASSSSRVVLAGAFFGTGGVTRSSTSFPLSSGRHASTFIKYADDKASSTHLPDASGAFAMTVKASGPAAAIPAPPKSGIIARIRCVVLKASQRIGNVIGFIDLREMFLYSFPLLFHPGLILTPIFYHCINPAIFLLDLDETKASEKK